MEKQKFFLIFIVAGALVIFLQQDSLQLTGRHWNKSASTFEHDENIFNVHKNRKNSNKKDWAYSKFIRQLSKSMTKNLKKHKTDKLKSKIDGFNPLSQFPVYNAQNVSRVLLLGYFRSGSSFVGDLLQQNWKTFYSYEPLHFMTQANRIGPKNVTDALNLISAIFNCDFKFNKYDPMRFKKDPFLLQWNKFLWNVCRFRPDTCFDVDYISDVCVRSKYNIIKLVRLPVKHLETLWKQIEHLNVKIVYLVRDPRGVYNSRKNVDWCKKDKVCRSISNICQEMRQDLNDYERLKALMGDNLMLVKYEDISLDPLNMSKELFGKLNLVYSPSVVRFLTSHTKSRRRGDSKKLYSTYRANSNFTAFHWTRKLGPKEITRIQSSCRDVLERLNYKFV